LSGRSQATEVSRLASARSSRITGRH
jgi:NADPH2:quinone reductase